MFKIRSKRRKKINPTDKEIKVDFVDDNGDSWEEYNVFHHEFINWFILTSSDNFTFLGAKEFLKNQPEIELDVLIAKSPWAGSESHNINYIEKVEMQGVIQKWIDHSISITHNLPL